MLIPLKSVGTSLLIVFTSLSCTEGTAPDHAVTPNSDAHSPDAPEYFNLRPALEKQYGYSHAVRIGNELKISGAVSMTDSGVVIGPGNIEVQMKNCYADLEKILTHFGYTFDDVYAENIYTTDMREFERVAGFRNSIYTKHFPAGAWLEVKGLALEQQVIEIDMEARK